MKHYTSSDFWKFYEKLPAEVQELADKNYELLKVDPRHPSLQLKLHRGTLVGAGRFAHSRHRDRCPGRHPVDLDWKPCRLRQVSSLTNSSTLNPAFPTVAQEFAVEMPSVAERHLMVAVGFNPSAAAER